MKRAWVRMMMMMKKIIILLPLVLALGGCYKSDSAHRNETPGEQAGRAAYQAKEDAKKAAKELSQEVKSFRHDAKEGYEDQKKKDDERKAEKRDVPTDER